MTVILTRDEILEQSRKDKDCKDFIPLEDGTIVGDWRYCSLSFQCMQKHPDKSGKLVGCISHHLYIVDPDDPEDVIFGAFCTGCLPKEERDDPHGKFQDNRILRAGDD
jgi:hypothetical protein